MQVLHVFIARTIGFHAQIENLGNLLHKNAQNSEYQNSVNDSGISVPKLNSLTFPLFEETR